MKTGVLGNFAKFTGKHLCQSLFFNKVAGLASLLTKRLWHRCFPVKFAKFLRTPFSQNTSGRLFIDYLSCTMHCNTFDDWKINETKKMCYYGEIGTICLPSRHTTSFERRIDVETTSCVYWVLIALHSMIIKLLIFRPTT